MNRTAQDEISDYVEEVRQALAGLPPATREELLEDLPEHLAEVLAEGGGTLADRLGTPQAYAAELLATAGITGSVPRPAAARVRFAGLRARYARLRGRFGEVMRQADDRVGPLLGYGKASDFLVLLRPAWWVLRGYLAAMAFAYFFGDRSGPLGLLPRLADNELVALLVLASFVVGSIWLGSRGPLTRRVHRRVLGAVSAFLVVFAVVGFSEMDGGSRDSGYMDANYVSEFDHVEDIFVYDEQGRLVRGAQLYDQNGQSIELGNSYCTDDLTGDWTESKQRGYPRCPDDAPFVVPAPDGSASLVPSPSLSASSQVSPATSPSTTSSSGK
ncbi:DUF1700 domain-containing protein [Actinoplanes sp. GCM10030250]|uniref:DUF1700 domain-containing protein n=1 Tax=Actinoplanes sp. GCM10030250 TaxID=3273376 RepID=UPI00360CDA7C